MKKTYVSPLLTSVNIQLEGHLLIDSGTGLSVDANSTVNTNFVKEDQSSLRSYNVWDDDWSE